jgi:hypothetical protein
MNQETAIETKKSQSLKFETVTFDHKSHGNGTGERLVLVKPSSKYKYRPDLLSERVPHNNKRTTVKR